MEDTLNIIRLLDVIHTQPDISMKHQSQSSIHNQCILELDQEQEEGDQKNSLRVQDQLKISPNLQTNSKEISENILSKSQSPNKNNIILKINQQNKEYKKYASQMIRMIRQSQQTLIKEFDQEQVNLERDYKLKKIQRQRERKEALQIAQEGIKNRQLKSLMMALKGSEDKIRTDCPLFLNLGKKFNSLSSSQTAVQSRKSSHQKICQQLPVDKQFDDRNFRKHSTKSEICSLETSLYIKIKFIISFTFHVQNCHFRYKSSYDIYLYVLFVMQNSLASPNFIEILIIINKCQESYPKQQIRVCLVLMLRKRMQKKRL